MPSLIHHYLDANAERAPAAAAVRFTGEQLDYAQLAERANRLAHTLLAHGVARGDRVGIYRGRGVELAVAVHGIMKAGAAYVPLDPAAPVARTATVLRQAGIRHLVSEPGKREALAELAALVPALECAVGLDGNGQVGPRCVPWSDVATAPAAPPAVPSQSASDLAYVIFTSGSTGEPKGIMHTHDSSLAFTRWAAHAYALVPEDRIANQAALHFDISIFDFFAGLLAGATTVIVPEGVMRLPASYAGFLADERITVWFTVPFSLSQLQQRGAVERHDFSRLRWVLFGGDVHSPVHIRALMTQFGNARFSNVYGPAETNGCTYWHLDTLPDDPNEPFPIGKACEGMQLAVIDERLRPVESGAGELAVCGPSTMPGYWQRPDLNERAFAELSHGNGTTRAYYRTGDRVEWLADGNLRFVGRVDRQVKTRGYRVELEEIETAMVSHPHVQEAAAFAVHQGGDGSRILAAIKPGPGETVELREIQAYLKKCLPFYAVPDEISVVEDFPRTPTGKIDRRQLRTQHEEPGG